MLLKLQINQEYKKLVKRLYDLQDKWHFEIIDLFNNEGLLASTKAHKNSMFDNVHPTQEGYFKSWLPEFEKHLTNFFS